MSITLQHADAAHSRAEERRPVRWTGTETFDVVLGGEHTGGSLGLLDHRLRRGDATPLHLHHDEAEVFYVLEGRIVAEVGGRRLEAGEGDALWLPPAVEHAMACASETARLVTLSTPAGFASFVRAAGVALDPGDGGAQEIDLDRLMAAAVEHRISIVGPPPGLLA